MTDIYVNSNTKAFKFDDEGKVWLKELLRDGIVEIKFTKKDGTERVMNCTLNESIVPIKEVKDEVKQDMVITTNSLTAVKTRVVNTDVLPVYDVNVKAWRSFRFDSIKEISYVVV